MTLAAIMPEAGGEIGGFIFRRVFDSGPQCGQQFRRKDFFQYFEGFLGRITHHPEAVRIVPCHFQMIDGK